jgi:type I restriction enzyme S subunit
VESADISEEAWLLDLEDIEKDTSRLLQRKKFRESPSKSTKTPFRVDDVLYGKLRPYLRNIAIMDRTFKPSAIASTAFAILHPVPFVDSRFLFYWLRSSSFEAEVSKRMKGVAYPAISDGDFWVCPIPLPPLAEQKRIVAKVDELMALCDRLEAQQQERETRHAALARASLARFAEAPTPANLNFIFHASYGISPADLRKSILTLAVQGKLVPQDAEPAFGSLESILAEAPLNGVSKGPTFDKSATEILRISAGTSRGDFYVNEEDLKHVDLSPDEIEKFQLAPGDLLACRFNGNLHYVGRFSYYQGESGRVQVNPDKLIRFRITTESNCPRYVCFAMNAAPTREAIEAMCATTAGNIGLSARRLKTVKITLPPHAEQRRIAAKVDELMALVDALETQLATARTTATALLAAAFAVLTAIPPAKTTASKALLPPVKATKTPPKRHFARAVLSAEIVHALHAERTFGRVKHQKIFHLCEHIAQITEIEGQYHREAAGPLDNRLIYANEAELKRQQWYAEFKRQPHGHAYKPLAKAGTHRKYLEEFLKDKLETVRGLIERMRAWDTDRCEIFSTAYAAWNDLILWGKPVTDKAILHEILERWNPAKKRFPETRWRAALQWIKEKGYAPTGFGKPTALPE